jgi:hypothetical protein
MHRLLTLSIALALSAGAAAQIYKSTDEKGNVVFSDTPPQGQSQATEVELKPLNTAPPPAALPRSKPEKKKKSDEGPQYLTRIVAPENESTIAKGPGDFSVSASVEPPLGRRESLQLLMDGEPQGPPQQGTSWSLTGVMRGPHDLVVARQSGDQVLDRSEPVRVYVLRPSIR